MLYFIVDIHSSGIPVTQKNEHPSIRERKYKCLNWNCLVIALVFYYRDHILEIYDIYKSTTHTIFHRKQCSHVYHIQCHYVA